MRFFGPLLFAGACLAACSQSEVESAVETARQIETQPASNRAEETEILDLHYCCLLYTSPSPRDATLSRMPSSA